jgi:hypothetical protein
MPLWLRLSLLRDRHSPKKEYMLPESRQFTTIASSGGKAYQPPCLIEYGRVEELTQDASAGPGIPGGGGTGGGGSTVIP